MTNSLKTMAERFFNYGSDSICRICDFKDALLSEISSDEEGICRSANHFKISLREYRKYLERNSDESDKELLKAPVPPAKFRNIKEWNSAYKGIPFGLRPKVNKVVRMGHDTSGISKEVGVGCYKH